MSAEQFSAPYDEQRNYGIKAVRSYCEYVNVDILRQRRYLFSHYLIKYLELVSIEQSELEVLFLRRRRHLLIKYLLDLFVLSAEE